MPFDITLFTTQGITPYRSEWIEFASNPRNTFSYKILFLGFQFDPSQFKVSAIFQVERSLNGELDLSYKFESLALNSTYVDKFGNIVSQYLGDPEQQEEVVINPDAWGTEYDRMAVLFNAPISDSLIVSGYVEELFDKGFFDGPKNKYIS